MNEMMKIQSSAVSRDTIDVVSRRQLRSAQLGENSTKNVSRLFLFMKVFKVSASRQFEVNLLISIII